MIFNAQISLKNNAFNNGMPLPQQQGVQKQISQKQLMNKKHPIRAGDWVCLVCSNLNFSFRNECNRCQSQTKKNNYIQNMILMGKQDAQEPNSNDNINTNININNISTSNIINTTMNSTKTTLGSAQQFFDDQYRLFQEHYQQQRQNRKPLEDLTHLQNLSFFKSAELNNLREIISEGGFEQAMPNNWQQTMQLDMLRKRQNSDISTSESEEHKLQNQLQCQSQQSQDTPKKQANSEFNLNNFNQQQHYNVVYPIQHAGFNNMLLITPPRSTQPPQQMQVRHEQKRSYQSQNNAQSGNKNGHLQLQTSQSKLTDQSQDDQLSKQQANDMQLIQSPSFSSVRKKVDMLLHSETQDSKQQQLNYVTDDNFNFKVGYTSAQKTPNQTNNTNFNNNNNNIVYANDLTNRDKFFVDNHHIDETPMKEDYSNAKGQPYRSPLMLPSISPIMSIHHKNVQDSYVSSFNAQIVQQPINGKQQPATNTNNIATEGIKQDESLSNAAQLQQFKIKTNNKKLFQNLDDVFQNVADQNTNLNQNQNNNQQMQQQQEKEGIAKANGENTNEATNQNQNQMKQPTNTNQLLTDEADNFNIDNVILNENENENNDCSQNSILDDLHVFNEIKQSCSIQSTAYNSQQLQSLQTLQSQQQPIADIPIQITNNISGIWTFQQQVKHQNGQHSLNINSFAYVEGGGQATQAEQAKNKNAQQTQGVPLQLHQVRKGGGRVKQDWICPNCQNLNYSFRECCNRCHKVYKNPQNFFQLIK